MACRPVAPPSKGTMWKKEEGEEDVDVDVDAGISATDCGLKA
jgi:hypothetical protein